jgi:two-component system, LytTR family, response regulator
MNYRTLIVDDETSECEQLERMLSLIDAPCDIIKKAANGFDAISIINNSKPDVVFLDIELPGINGIELLRHCTFDPYIIFTTADDNYAVEAFEAKTISYLVKPISEVRLKNALQKLLRMVRIPIESITSILKPTPHSSTAMPLQLLPVKNGEHITLLKWESIVWIEAKGKYTVIATKERRYVCSYCISELEQRLMSPCFIRIHRSYIVNLQHVVELRRTGIRKLKIITDAPREEDILVGTSYYNELKNRLEID